MKRTKTTGVVFSTPFSSLIEPLKKTDLVNLKTVPMESIPAGDNPFHHDASNMGTHLSRGWMMMHQGEFADHGLTQPYLVNTITGQRFLLNFEAQEETYLDAVWCGDLDIDEGELYVWSRSYQFVEFYTLIDHLRIKAVGKQGLVRGYKHSPVYVYIVNHFVRFDVVCDGEAFDKWCKEEEIIVDINHPAVLAAKRYEAAQLMVAATNEQVGPVVIIDEDAVRKRLVIEDLQEKNEFRADEHVLDTQTKHYANAQDACFTDTTVLDRKHGDKGVHVRVLKDGE